MIERDLPGVPIAQSERLSAESRFFDVRAENVEIPEEIVYGDQAIGDEKLLRYLTGDQSTPYDEGTPVVITSAEVKVDSVELSYEINENDATTRTVPAVGARAADPHMEAIFVPSKIVRDLGFQLQPEELIVDPTLRRSRCRSRSVSMTGWTTRSPRLTSNEASRLRPGVLLAREQSHVPAPSASRP
ncbi:MULTISPECIES: hypothetical protein [unclassified Nonomuraea]|uniref:hypothetical protein n=1 Tax=unclassified Nonomuraea TaxID=2593643 RepID=UPI00340B5DE1